MARVIGVSAASGTGKTTFLRGVLPRLKAEGLRVGVIKRTHHDIDPDTPGKDSYELRRAGADRTLLAARERWVRIDETPDCENLPIAGLVARL